MCVWCVYSYGCCLSVSVPALPDMSGYYHSRLGCMGAGGRARGPKMPTPLSRGSKCRPSGPGREREGSSLPAVRLTYLQGWFEYQDDGNLRAAALIKALQPLSRVLWGLILRTSARQERDDAAALVLILLYHRARSLVSSLLLGRAQAGSQPEERGRCGGATTVPASNRRERRSYGRLKEYGGKSKLSEVSGHARAVRGGG